MIRSLLIAELNYPYFLTFPSQALLDEEGRPGRISVWVIFPTRLCLFFGRVRVHGCSTNVLDLFLLYSPLSASPTRKSDVMIMSHAVRGSLFELNSRK